MFLLYFLTQLEPLMIKSGHPNLIYVFMSLDVMKGRNKIEFDSIMIKFWQLMLVKLVKT